VKKNRLLIVIILGLIFLVSCTNPVMNALMHEGAQELDAMIATAGAEGQAPQVLPEELEEILSPPEPEEDLPESEPVPQFPTPTYEPVTAASTPTMESLPTGPVPAGTTVFYDGWALTLADTVSTDDDQIFLALTVRNMGEKERVFRYVKNGITLQDNLGNQFPFDMSFFLCDRYPENINLTIQLTVGGEKTQSISSDSYGCSWDYYFPPFNGRISLDAEYLIVTINNWGPFNGVVFHLYL